MDIQVQLDSNPQMAVIVSELDPDAEDLVAIATFIRDLNDNPVSAAEIADWHGQLAEMAAARGPEMEFLLTERDKLVMQIQSFDTVLADWPHRGEPHGLVWVAYDENGEGAVVRDQGGFHNGVHPARGNPLTVAANAR